MPREQHDDNASRLRCVHTVFSALFLRLEAESYTAGRMTRTRFGRIGLENRNEHTVSAGPSINSAGMCQPEIPALP